MEILTVDVRMAFAIGIHLINVFIGKLPFCAAPIYELAKIKARGLGRAWAFTAPLPGWSKKLALNFSPVWRARLCDRDCPGQRAVDSAGPFFKRRNNATKRMSERPAKKLMKKP